MKHKGRYLAVLVLLALTPIVRGQVAHSCPAVPPGTGYVNPMLDKGLSDYDVLFYHIDLEANNTTTVISGSGSVYLRILVPADTILLELSSQLDISDVLVDSAVHAKFKHENDLLWVALGSEKAAGEKVMIKVSYKGDAGLNRGFFAGISSSKDYFYGQNVTYTLSEPMNASDWFPVKEVLEDKADSAWIFITTSNSLMAGAPGVLEEVAAVNSTKHQFRWKTRYTVAYYLLSMTIADYRDFSFMAPLSEEGDSVLVQNFIYDSDSYFQSNQEDILATGDMIHLYSRKLIDYPFHREKYGHCLAPMGGGMEHQTMTTLSGFGFTLVAHELAHQWFGDYVTCGDWRDIWINEGFASYMEYIALQNLHSQEEADDWIIQAMTLATDAEGTVYVPEDEVENPWRLFDYSLSYKKGAVLLHMIRYELDDDSVFFAVLRNYLNEYAFQNATAADFRSVLEETSKKDFSCFFDQWYYGKGYPVFSMVWKQSGDSLIIQSSETGSSDETPFFVTDFDLTVHTETGSSVIRCRQEESAEVFVIPVEGSVSKVLFNETNTILASGTITRLFPEGRSYTLGPNPFKENMKVDFAANTGERLFTVTSLDGKESILISSADNPVILPLSGLSDGPYLLTITEGKAKHTEKILKISE